MALKQYVRFVIPANNKYIKTSCTLMGLSFFLRMLYFFGLSGLDTFTGLQWAFQLILPALACGAFIVLLGILKWNLTGLCGILGSVLLLLLAVSSIGCGSVVRTMLSIVVYVGAAGLLLLTVGGYFPIRAIFNGLMFICAAVRIFVFDFGRISLKEWVMEGSVIFLLFSLALFVNGLKPRPVQKHE